MPSKISRIGFVKQDWPAIIAEVLVTGGFSVPVLADMIRSTPPTVRAMWVGKTEPSHSQGVYLLATRKALRAGTHPVQVRYKKNG